MDEVVFVFGAGASASAGAPLMRNFLDRAERLQSTGGTRSPESFELVFRGLAQLMRVHSKATLDTDNLESVFAAFEMAALFGRPLGDLEEEEVADLPGALRDVIADTLDATVKLSYEREKGFLPDSTYKKFVDVLIKKVGSSGRRIFPSLFTFNYDVALDYALHWSNLRVTYRLDFPANTAGDIELGKLHGSLNWGQCPKCNEVVPHGLGQYFKEIGWRTPRADMQVPLNYPSRLIQLDHCEEHKLGGPFVVPPTWNKAAHYSQIQPVWRLAAERLSQAQHIYVIGYSLPESDHFFRHLYGLGTLGPTRLKRFCVVNPEPSGGPTEQRFRELLGPSAASRFEWRADTFDGAMPSLEKDDWGA